MLAAPVWPWDIFLSIRCLFTTTANAATRRLANRCSTLRDLVQSVVIDSRFVVLLWPAGPPQFTMQGIESLLHLLLSCSLQLWFASLDANVDHVMVLTVTVRFHQQVLVQVAVSIFLFSLERFFRAYQLLLHVVKPGSGLLWRLFPILAQTISHHDNAFGFRINFRHHLRFFITWLTVIIYVTIDISVAVFPIHSP